MKARSVKVAEARQLLGEVGSGNSFLALFMPEPQRAVLRSQLFGEEAEGVANTILNTVARIRSCPVTYEQDGKGMKAVAHLHYFCGGIDIYVTELDSLDTVSQAFGWVDLGHGGELGYLSIAEIVSARKIELDLYFEPKPLEEALKK